MTFGKFLWWHVLASLAMMVLFLPLALVARAR